MTGPRIQREQKTLGIMFNLYCSKKHLSHDGLCEDCRALYLYSLERLERCPFKENKTTCAACRIHCYQKEKQEKIRDIMRFAGPRMLWRAPILTIQHLLDQRQKPVQAAKRQNNI